MSGNKTYATIGHSNKLRSNILGMYGMGTSTSTDLKKGESIELLEEQDLQKGGKRAQIGEVRLWAGQKWVKHSEGWVHVHEKSGKATLEKPGGAREAAGEHHISHYKEHMDRHTRESSTHEGTQSHSEKRKEIVDSLKKEVSGGEDEGVKEAKRRISEDYTSDELDSKHEEHTQGKASSNEGSDEHKFHSDMLDHIEKTRSERKQQNEKVEKNSPFVTLSSGKKLSTLDSGGAYKYREFTPEDHDEAAKHFFKDAEKFKSEGRMLFYRNMMDRGYSHEQKAKEKRADAHNKKKKEEESNPPGYESWHTKNMNDNLKHAHDSHKEEVAQEVLGDKTKDLASAPKEKHKEIADKLYNKIDFDEKHNGYNSTSKTFNKKGGRKAKPGDAIPNAEAKRQELSDKIKKLHEQGFDPNKRQDFISSKDSSKSNSGLSKQIWSTKSKKPIYDGEHPDYHTVGGDNSYTSEEHKEIANYHRGMSDANGSKIKMSSGKAADELRDSVQKHAQLAKFHDKMSDTKSKHGSEKKSESKEINRAEVAVQVQGIGLEKGVSHSFLKKVDEKRKTVYLELKDSRGGDYHQSLQQKVNKLEQYLNSVGYQLDISGEYAGTMFQPGHPDY